MINIIIVCLVEHNRALCRFNACRCTFIVLFHPKRQLNLNNNNKRDIYCTDTYAIQNIIITTRTLPIYMTTTNSDTYLELSTRRLFCDMQLTLQSTLPWSLQIVSEKRPKFALIILIVSPGSHSIVNVLSSHAYAVPTFGTEKKRKKKHC